MDARSERPATGCGQPRPTPDAAESRRPHGAHVGPTDLVELAGRTLGIVGYGRIGRGVAAVGRAFGMRVLAHRRTPGDEPECVGLERLLRESDVVSLHCPLTPETQGLIDAGRIALMKPTAFLVNTSRGALVVEADLAAALEAGRLAGAGLDVLSVEPPPAT